MTRDEEIEGLTLAALQLSQYLFMQLVDRNVIDPSEAKQWLEQGIKSNSTKGTGPHRMAVDIFELLRQGLGRPATLPSSL